MDIMHIVIAQIPSYIIYIGHDYQLHWQIDDPQILHNICLTPSDDCSKAFNRVAVLESAENDLLADAVRLKFKKMLGETVWRIFEGKFSMAINILDEAEAYISRRKYEITRRLRLKYCSFPSIGCFGLALAFWLTRWYCLPLFGLTGFWVIMAGLFGGLGAFASLAQRNGELDDSCSGGKHLLFLECMMRISTGLVSGVVMATIAKSLVSEKIVLNYQMTYLFIGFAAGFVERWLPSLVQTFTAKDLQEQKLETGTNVCILPAVPSPGTNGDKIIDAPSKQPVPATIPIDGGKSALCCSFK